MENNEKKMIAIFGVVVLYNCQINESISIQTLNNSLEKNGVKMNLLIYDNSPTRQRMDGCFSLLNFNLEYFHDSLNPGVSKPYNVAANIAQDKGKTHLLLMDQDTEFPEPLISNYLHAIEDFPNEKLFAPKIYVRNTLMSPNICILKKSFTLKRPFYGRNTITKINFFNSGLLVEINAFINVGGFNEKVGLYFSDYNFISRIKKYYSTYVLIDTDCVHDLNSNNEADLSNFIRTYKKYLDGAFYAGESLGEKVQYFLLVSLRSIKMLLKHRKFIFVRLYLNRYFNWGNVRNK